ncbi:hypothetical protein [Epilithonimonas sp.]|uniref:hypothetical protein n=1 Tax=Epilithonimonas sp. TaxID=2894511 RepID=UPI0035AE0021
MTKEEKAEYDRKYREKNKEKIRLKKKLYNESEAGRQMQKRARGKRKEYHNEFCRRPEQRQKEKNRRYLKLGQNKLKNCLVCHLDKPIIEFKFGEIFHDKRYYLCKECEKKSFEETGLRTKGVIQAITTRCDYRLSRQDIAEHPYFIEANKYLISLKKLTK